MSAVDKPTQSTTERRGMEPSLMLRIPMGDMGALGGLVQADALQRDYRHQAAVRWRAEPTLEGVDSWASMRGPYGEVEIVLRDENSVTLVRVALDKDATALAYADSPAGAVAAANAARDTLPTAEEAAEDTIPVTFWTYSPHGPRSLRRELDAPSWEEIIPNYAPATEGGLADLMHSEWRPGSGGQLVLWHGEPGTGKTTALRALAREWKGWCDAHYIADPDNFFGPHADYLIDVMVQDLMMESARPVGPGGGAFYGSPPREPRWRLLILEDAGELLQVDARREVGQALSRFLNVVDGLIGQGLRVLVLVTTNEELGKLHPAVHRPGRVADEIEFTRLTADASAEWLRAAGVDESVSSAQTIAELYARLDGRDAVDDRHPVGFAA